MGIFALAVVLFGVGIWLSQPDPSLASNPYRSAATPSVCESSGVRSNRLLIPRSPFKNNPAVDVVVLATIERILPTRWRTESGALPVGRTLFADGTALDTPVVLRVSAYWEGEPHSSSLTVLSEGGTDRKSGCTWYGEGRMRRFEVGDRVVAFLGVPEHTQDLGLVRYEHSASRLNAAKAP
jgi:hypothetical protein